MIYLFDDTTLNSEKPVMPQKLNMVITGFLKIVT